MKEVILWVLAAFSIPTILFIVLYNATTQAQSVTLINKCMGVGKNCSCHLVSTDDGWKYGNCIKERT